MASNNSDHWSATKYQSAAGFVPQLTTKVVKYLDPQPSDRILDIGCGDGVLTVEIAKRCEYVAGLDSSQAMIKAAKDLADNQNLSNCHFDVVDCAHLSDIIDTTDSANYSCEQFNKVFSNAAFHWIFRDESRRDTVFPSAFKALQPGGSFVFECGGAGNVAEVVTAIIAALVEVVKLSIEAAREKIPWYFASEAWVKQKLEEAGFEVELVELEYRPTGLSEREGVEGWVRLFGASILDDLEKDVSEQVVKHVCELLQWSIVREDESQYVGYVRLRAIAKKPISEGTI